MARAPLGLTLPPGDGHMANHAVQGMSGLMTGIHVSPRPGEPSTALRGDRGRRTFRLVVGDVPNASRPEDLRFALAEGAAAPSRDSVARMGPPLVVNAGESVSVTVVNTIDVERKQVPVGSNGDYRYPDLDKKINDEWTSNGSHRAPSDMKFDQAVLHSDNSTPFSDVVAVIDAIYTPKRDVQGAKDKLPAFNVTFAVN